MKSFKELVEMVVTANLPSMWDDGGFKKMKVLVDPNFNELWNFIKSKPKDSWAGMVSKEGKIHIFPGDRTLHFEVDRAMSLKSKKTTRFRFRARSSKHMIFTHSDDTSIRAIAKLQPLQKLMSSKNRDYIVTDDLYAPGVAYLNGKKVKVSVIEELLGGMF